MLDDKDVFDDARLVVWADVVLAAFRRQISTLEVQRLLKVKKLDTSGVKAVMDKKQMHLDMAINIKLGLPLYRMEK